MKHLFKKEQRYPCPDCEAVCDLLALYILVEYCPLLHVQWYEGDAKRIQFSCHHKQPSESKESLKMRDIGFPESDSD